MIWFSTLLCIVALFIFSQPNFAFGKKCSEICGKSVEILDKENLHLRLFSKAFVQKIFYEKTQKIK